MDKFASPCDSSSSCSTPNRSMISKTLQRHKASPVNPSGEFKVEKRHRSSSEHQGKRSASSTVCQVRHQPVARAAVCPRINCWQVARSWLVVLRDRLWSPGNRSVSPEDGHSRCHPHQRRCHRRIGGIPAPCSAMPVMWRAEPERLCDWRSESTARQSRVTVWLSTALPEVMLQDSC